MSGQIADSCPAAATPAVVEKPTLVDFNRPSSLCSTGLTPNILTGAFLRFLEEHYSEADRIEDPMLRDQVFHAQPADTTQGLVNTGILIDPLYKWNVENFSQRPAIYIKRGTMTPERLGINDGLTTGLGKDANGNFEVYQGDVHYVGVQGSHTFFCIGRVGAEVEGLATETFHELLGFAPVLRQELTLKRMAVSEVTEVSKLAEYDEHFVVAIAIGWYYFEKWRLKPMGPWLKSIAVDIRG